MLDYTPLIIAFILGVLGLLLRTTRDPEGDALRKEMTLAGWVVLSLLASALLVGVVTTRARNTDNRKRITSETERYARDSALWATQLSLANKQLLIQSASLAESRSTAKRQMDRLDASLVASTGLASRLSGLNDTVRLQSVELTRTLALSRELRDQSERIRNPLAAPNITVRVGLPEITAAKSRAIERINSRSTSDSIRQRRYHAIVNSQYGESTILVPQEWGYDLFPDHLNVILWRPIEGVCGSPPMNGKDAVYLSVRTDSASRWTLYDDSFSRWLTLRPSQAVIENRGIQSLWDLHGGCLSVSFNYFPTPMWMQDDRSALYSEIWGGSQLLGLTLDFGDGRTIEYFGTRKESYGEYPILMRLPNRFPWEPIDTTNSQ